MIVPAELALDPLDRRRGRRRAGGQDPHARRAPRRSSSGALAMPISTVGAAQNIVIGSRSISSKTRARLDLAQADVRAARPRSRSRRTSSRWRGTSAASRGSGRAGLIGTCTSDADDVKVGVAVRDHHALGPRGRAAGVVDREQVVLGDLGALERGRHARRSDGGERLLVVEPAVASALQRDEVLDRRELGADAVDRLEVVGVRRRRPSRRCAR